MKKEGVVYLLQDVYENEVGEVNKVLKIGFSEKPFEDGRIKAYKTHNYGFKFLKEREGDKNLETYFHREFKKYQLSSSEWFRYDKEIIDRFSSTFDLREIWDPLISLVEKDIRNVRRLLESNRDDIIAGLCEKCSPNYCTEFERNIYDFLSRINKCYYACNEICNCFHCSSDLREPIYIYLGAIDQSDYLRVANEKVVDHILRFIIRTIDDRRKLSLDFLEIFEKSSEKDRDVLRRISNHLTADYDYLTCSSSIADRRKDDDNLALEIIKKEILGEE